MVAFLVIAGFLSILGLVVWVFPDTNLLDYGFAELSGFFRLSPFVLLLLVPALTMKSLSEEYKSGTLELLLTKPLKIQEVVIGKFLAALGLVSLAIIPTLVYYFLLRDLSVPSGNIDTAATIGSYFGLILLSGVFVALGILCSSLTNNQIVAFLLASVLSYLWYDGLHQLASLWKGGTSWWLDYFSLHYQFESFSRGLIDSRSILFMLTAICLLLLGTSEIVRKKTS